MMWRIEAPNNEYNGVTAGVTFVGGVGETDVDPSDYFQRHGYTVAEVQADEPSTVADAAKPKKKTSAKETTNGRHENVIPASAVYVPQPGGAAKPLDTVLSGMPKQAAAVGNATTGQEMATINALLASLRNAGIIAK